MITVGFDFGTHQTKICYENVEAGTTFYDVFRFKQANGEEALTLPSYIRLCEDGTLRYGFDAMSGGQGGQTITYFKQDMFSWMASDKIRSVAEKWSVLYLAFIIILLDRRFKTFSYVVQMGMPTDANPGHYNFCKRQAIKVMASAMLLARNVFKGDLTTYISTPYSQLVDLVAKCIAAVPCDIHEARKRYPIFVFPEAYAALIPLINDHKLPTIGPNLFVDIGGGTVDISLFTNRLDMSIGRGTPYLYYYYSIPYGLNMIMGDDFTTTHNVKVGQGQITRQCVERFRVKLIDAVKEMMLILEQEYAGMGKTHVMPFVNLCAQALHFRPVCYSGGGSMFHGLKLPVAVKQAGVSCDFSQVTTVSQLIDHSKLYVDDGIFHVLATAFALSHRSLCSDIRSEDPDAIRLVSIDKLFGGVRIPQDNFPNKGNGWMGKKKWSW